ncbi:hypothetical protein HMN09_01108100 [Mycena chlorophos]|uniref:Short-chain dehydrogenase/reductase family protein n=1 Tax=Mycena chlorophos TaxID=658473 RepID=A0A8H6SEJ2_MYCCL|nr:hypothetical protein HMN09_01108100 [Mycena chlorophos]
MSRFTAETTAAEVASAFSEEIKGKNVLITGTSLNGIGFETALAIAKYADLVILAGQSDERLKLSEAAILKENPTAKIRRLLIDLSSQSSVRQAAAEVNMIPEPLDVLIHNAAAPLGALKITVDGLESQFATNHVGPFLFTKLVLGKLLERGAHADGIMITPRVIFISSNAHLIGAGVDFARLQALSSASTPADRKQVEENAYKSSQDAYYQSKSANILTGIELSRRANGKILAYSLHPGIILTNNTQSTQPESIAAMQAMEIFDAEGKPVKEVPWITQEQGAATTVAAAFDPSLVATPGAYLKDCVVTKDFVASHSSDLTNASKLWELTESIIGEKFEL